MDSRYQRFENIARRAHKFADKDARDELPQHPFDTRGVHPSLMAVSQDLFDNGHYAQATFEAFKYVDNVVERLSASGESGFKNMMKAFACESPLVLLTPDRTMSDKDEQKGYQFLFAGSMLAIRNPRGHRFSIKDSPDICLDHLALASVLLRRLEQSGYNVSMT